MAPQRAVAANRYDHSFHSGTSFVLGCVYFVHIADFIGFQFQTGREKGFNVKGVFGVRIGCEFEVGVFGEIGRASCRERV